jgi:hypothetical protein
MNNIARRGKPKPRGSSGSPDHEERNNNARPQAIGSPELLPYLISTHLPLTSLSPVRSL